MLHASCYSMCSGTQIVDVSAAATCFLGEVLVEGRLVAHFVNCAYKGIKIEDRWTDADIPWGESATQLKSRASGHIHQCSIFALQGADGKELEFSLAGAGASFGPALDSSCEGGMEGGCFVSGELPMRDKACPFNRLGLLAATRGLNSSPTQALDIQSNSPMPDQNHGVKTPFQLRKNGFSGLLKFLIKVVIIYTNGKCDFRPATSLSMCVASADWTAWWRDLDCIACCAGAACK